MNKSWSLPILAASGFLLTIPRTESQTNNSTTIDISNTVIRPAVKRFGLNLGWVTYFDTGQIMKELVFRNPGFEPQLYQSIVQVVRGTPTSFLDDNTSATWTNGFWNNAAFEVIWGSARGRTGMVSASIAPSAGSGVSYQLADSGMVPAAGDFVILRKTFSGDATAGWTAAISGGGTISDETADLPPGTPGRQAVRLSATIPGAFASISTFFDTSAAGSFIQLHGRYRLSFKAKGLGGGNTLNCAVARLAPGNTVFLNQNQILSNSWQTFQVDFTANENGGARGFVQVQFRPINPSAILLDEVSLRQIDGDIQNPTALRDSVMSALRSFNPGILRYANTEFGDSLDNQIAPLYGRLRSGFRVRATPVTDVQLGLHEFLEVCESIGAEPWYSFPTTFSTNEMANLIEYLAGPASTPYGGRRAARGHSTAWADVFPKIHLEFGNEVWNSADYNGETFLNPAAHGNRASEIFGAARQAPSYRPAQFDLVLGGQAAFVARSAAIHSASTNHDAFAVAPYFGGRVDSFSNSEDLFGPLFAEPEWVNGAGYMREQLSAMRNSNHPTRLAVYEVNLHTTDGAISQTALNAFTPSLGAGLAVADHMLMMLRDLGITDQLLHSLTGYAFSRTDAKFVLLWGAVRDMGITDRKRPQFLALKLANEALAGDLMETTVSGDNPTWSQLPINGMQPAGAFNAHYLQTYAFQNGPQKSLLVFNLHRNAPLNIRFAGSNAPGGTVTLKRLTAANITDSNEDTNNVATTEETLNNFDSAAALPLPPYSMTLWQWGSGAGASSPRITMDPQSQTVTNGVSLVLTVKAEGIGPFTYQWQKDGMVLPGATLDTLVLSNVTRAAGGRYTTTVSNAFGSAQSAPAAIRVLSPQRINTPTMLPNGLLRVSFSDSDGGSLGAPDLAKFELQTTTNLENAVWLPSPEPLLFTAGVLQVDLAMEAGHRFFRVLEKP